MARTQSANYEEIRQEILRRSAALFARVGYPNASISDLAQENGISRGLLYHYFASKDALLDEMLNDHLDMLIAEVRLASERGDDAEARFRNMISAMVLVNAGSRDLQVVLLHDLQNLGDDERAGIVAKQREILKIFSTLIRACDTAGTIPEHELTAKTMMLTGMVNYTYLWYDASGPVGPERYAEMVADTFLAGLRR